ncbi:unnamed protein product [Penicillium viridicatum]
MACGQRDSGSVSSDSLIADNEISFARNVWPRTYDRLGLDVPFLELLQRTESGRRHDQFRQAETLLRKYEEGCDLAPKIGRRINRSRALLGLLVNASVANDERYALVSDGDIRLPPVFGLHMYDRLGLNGPFGRFSVDPGSAVPGRRLTFGWLESIPVDLEGSQAI